MFSRWGAFVYRFRRPVALIAVVIAIASSTLAAQASSALSVGRLARRRTPSRPRCPSRLDTEFGAGKSSIIALFRADRAGRRRDVAPRSRARSRPRPPASPTTPHVTGIVGYAETGDTRFISTAGDAAYVVIELDMTDEASVDAVDDIRAAIVPPAGYTLPADRLRADHQGLRRAVREGPPEGRARVAAGRRRSSSSSSSPRSSRPACRCSSPASPSRAAWRSSTSSPSRSR